MRWSAVAFVVAACGSGLPAAPSEPPQPPGKTDGGFTVTGAKAWYLAGTALTPGDDRVELAITAPADTGVVDVWLDLRYAGRAERTGAGFAWQLELADIAVGEHQLLLAADAAGVAFAEVRFQRSQPLYVVVSNDWDNSDNADPMLERQERLHARHPHLLLTHFFGPYVFTDPAVPESRKQFLVDWVTGLRDQFGDEIGLHVHPYCNFVTTAGVACRTSPSFAYAAGDTTGYTVILSSYTTAELDKIFARARELFVQHGLGAPTSFRAGGWTADLHVLESLAGAGHLADSSGCNWARLEEWQGHAGASLYPWNAEHWAPIDDTSQPYYPATDDILADADPHLPVLEIPDNGLLVDYVSGAEMIDMFERNWPARAALREPVVYSIGYHPPNFSETYFARIDQALTEIDRHLAADGRGPVVYVRMTELTKAFPRP